jgi:hypothetical protein
MNNNNTYKGDNVEKNIIHTVDTAKKIGRTIKLSTRAMRIILTDKSVRNEITGIVKSLLELAKKSIEEAGETVLKDKVFMDNLKNTSRKIGTHLAITVYSTIDGLTLGTVSDIRAVYSSFLASLNAINLLSSILKLPIVKIDEKIKGDSRDIVSLVESLKSIKTNYETILQKLNNQSLNIKDGIKNADIKNDAIKNDAIKNGLNKMIGSGIYGSLTKKNKGPKRIHKRTVINRSRSRTSRTRSRHKKGQLKNKFTH